MPKMTRAEAEAAVAAKRRDPVNSSATQFEVRKAAAGGDNIYQPSSGHEISELEGVTHLTKKGARQRYLDEKIEKASR